MYTFVGKTNENYLIRKFDYNGKLINLKEPFSADLFLESTTQEINKAFKTGKSLKKFTFTDYNSYYQFKEKMTGKCYGTIAPVYQKLSKINIDEQQIDKVNFWGIDIEVYAKGEFPKPELANKFPVVVISLSNNKTDEYYTWVYDIYNRFTLTSKDNWTIKSFSNEVEMLYDVINFWKKNLPDIHILTGWNSSEYDIQYLFNRISFITENAQLINSFSPFKITKLSQRYGTYDILGIPHLDYMKLFKKYNLTPRESFRLEAICQEELKTGKINHSEYYTFAEFYEKDINKYVEYNLMDVKLLNQLDKKFKYIDLVVAIAIFCKINFEDVASPIRCWEGLCYNELLKDNIQFSSNGNRIKEEYQGAYVKEPIPGISKDIISYDLASLYPSTCRAMNISPETLLLNNDNKASIESILSGYIPEKYHNENKIVCPDGNIYTKSKHGIFPIIMKRLFTLRIHFKNIMKQKRKELQELKSQLKEIENG